MSGLSSPNVPGTYGEKGVPSSTNLPGTRHGAIGWSDRDGILWMFGGSGFSNSMTGEKRSEILP
jgi:hypothetical protein